MKECEEKKTKQLLWRMICVMPVAERRCRLTSDAWWHVTTCPELWHDSKHGRSHSSLIINPSSWPLHHQTQALVGIQQHLYVFKRWWNWWTFCSLYFTISCTRFSPLLHFFVMYLFFACLIACLIACLVCCGT